VDAKLTLRVHLGTPKLAVLFVAPPLFYYSILFVSKLKQDSITINTMNNLRPGVFY
jgi:hypothetical protein